MKLSDCNFSEKDIKQLQDYRDRQKDTRLKLRFMAILSVVYYTGGVEWQLFIHNLKKISNFFHAIVL